MFYIGISAYFYYVKEERRKHKKPHHNTNTFRQIFSTVLNQFVFVLLHIVASIYDQLIYQIVKVSSEIGQIMNTFLLQWFATNHLRHDKKPTQRFNIHRIQYVCIRMEMETSREHQLCIKCLNFVAILINNILQISNIAYFNRFYLLRFNQNFTKFNVSFFPLSYTAIGRMECNGCVLNEIRLKLKLI